MSWLEDSQRFLTHRRTHTHAGRRRRRDAPGVPFSLGVFDKLKKRNVVWSTMMSSEMCIHLNTDCFVLLYLISGNTSISIRCRFTHIVLICHFRTYRPGGVWASNSISHLSHTCVCACMRLYVRHKCGIRYSSIVTMQSFRLPPAHYFISVRIMIAAFWKIVEREQAFRKITSMGIQFDVPPEGT